MIAAFAYLIFNTSRNRVLSMARRLRSPRYAIGLLLGLAYFWFILGRHVFAARSSPAAATVSTAYAALAPAFILVVVAGIWIFGGDRTALAFSEAEVSMLLTAPVARRTLVGYKLARSQIVILVNVVIWVFLLRRGSSVLPGALSAVGVWAMFTTLNLHRMGAALVRASQVEYRATGKKRAWIAKAFGFLIVMTVIGTLVAGPLSSLSSPDGSDPFAFLRSFMLFLDSPGVRTVLFPFRLVVAPIFAPSPAEWAKAILPALALVLAHVWWVLRSDAPFEEAAALASAEYAKRVAAIRSRRTMAAQPSAGSGGRTIAIASTGNPAVAIIWKNVIALRRTFQAGSLVRILFLIVIISGVVGWRSGDIARSIGVTALIMAVMTPLFGMQIVRTDLRSDMMHLPFLKTLPLAGADLVLAEIASGAVPLAVVQFVFLTIGAIAVGMSASAVPLSAAVRAGILIVSPVVLFALNGALSTIVNGTAVLFPSWIRLGPGGPGGVEMMGQTMLSMIASGIAFLLLMLLPVAVGAAGYFMLQSSQAVAIAGACLLGALALAAESYAVILALGRAFERAEPQQVS